MNRFLFVKKVRPSYVFNRSRVRKKYFSTISDVEKLRRKLKWRCLERGMVENEIILRSFIKDHLSLMNEEDLRKFEVLLDAPDPDLYQWFSGTSQIPEDLDSTVFQQVKSFVHSQRFLNKMNDKTNLD